VETECFPAQHLAVWSRDEVAEQSARVGVPTSTLGLSYPITRLSLEIIIAIARPSG
jgi:hypothetical protein